MLFRSRNITAKAQSNPKKVVFAEADHLKILKAAQGAYEEGVAFPILLGDKNTIIELMNEYGIELPEVTIIDPKSETEEERRTQFGMEFFNRRKRKGLTEYEAVKLMRERNHFGAMMVDLGYADAMITGLTRSYRSTVRPLLQIIGLEKEVKTAAGMYILNTKRGQIGRAHV